MSTAPTPGFVEGQTLRTDLSFDVDACVIGSGPGGAVTAERLAQAGLSVLVLEEGGYFSREHFRQRESEAYPFLYQDGGQRTTKDLAVTVMQGKAVGGGSVVNWTTCFRTPPDVVEHWQKKHGVDGFTSKDLEPHFVRIEERLSIAENPLELANRNNRTLYDGCKALGYEAAPLKRNVKGCAQTGSCGHGCPIDAKQSMLVTMLPDAVARGAQVLSRCRVDSLVYDSAGTHVTEVRGTLLDAFGHAPTGSSVVVRARTVVVSAGAINSPALLLRSGTLDPHGLLGRRTFLHPVIASLAIYDEPVLGYRGAPQSVASHHFAHRGPEVGYFLEAGPIHPMLTSVALPGFGKDHHDVMEQLPNVAGHLALMIDGFHDDVVGGSVSLAPSGAPVLAYPIADRVWNAMRDAQKVLARVAFASGARSVSTGHDPAFTMKSIKDIDGIDALPYAPCKVGVFSAHQMGGCGMNDDDKRGVVRSSDLRHHQVENLHVIDGSVFPTSLGVNPQVSIYGLSSLAATRLVEALKHA